MEMFTKVLNMKQWSMDWDSSPTYDTKVVYEDLVVSSLP
jgi:hypothetical protein